MRHRSARRDRQYAAIPNAAMRDNELSIEARGMLALLMTYADNWSFNRDHLMKVAQIGRDKFQRIMRELIAAGYVSREAMRGEGGQVSGSTWFIHDDPDRQPENPSVGDTEGLKNRQPEKPTDGFSGPLRRPTDKKTKREECVHTILKDEIPDGFEKFFKVHPRPRDRDRCLELTKAAIADGISITWIIQSAERYRAENKGNSPMYIAYADNWLDQKRWQEFPMTSPIVATNHGESGIAAFWAEKVRNRAYVPSNAINASLAQIMIRDQLVTPDELRAAGIQP